jgi:hypothetical protein
MLLPPKLEEFIPNRYLRRVVDEIIEGIEIDTLLLPFK